MENLGENVAADPVTGGSGGGNRSGGGIKLLKVLLGAAVIFGLLAAIGYWQVNSLMSPVAKQKKDVLFIVPPGASTAGIASSLEKEGLIRNALAFRVYARVKGLDAKLQAGEYTLSPTMPLPQIASSIMSGDVNLHKVTIPEGYTTVQIATLLEQKGLAKKAVFLQEVATGDFSEFTFLMNLPSGERRLEGYLFPDTYSFSRGMTERDIIRAMLKQFGESIPADYEDKAKKAGLSLAEAVTLASVIEREAKKDAERPVVSSVFHNRLKKGMKLESCATVQYVLGKQKQRLLYKDLETPSPYNTYINEGLPPGPIASPGKPSLLAAVEPEDTDYYFFVVLTDGEHIFSQNWAEHQQNTRKYRERFLNP